MQTSLVDEVRTTYADRPLFSQLVDDSVIFTLGLTRPEVIVLCCLLLAEGHATQAMESARGHGLKDALIKSAAASLEARELIARDTVDPRQWTFDGAERALRMQLPEEVEAVEGAPLGPPSTKLVLRSLREQVLMLSRSENSVPRGLARVYTFVYGGTTPSGADFGILGMIGRELGLERAALLLLEFAGKQMENPLREILPMARARAVPYRPEGAPDVDEQNRYMAAIAEQARQKADRL